MYIIFIDETPIYLTDSLEYSAENNFYFKDDITIEELLKLAKDQAKSSFYLYHSDLKELWKEFKWFFKIEKAAGGIVENEEGKTLFIYRFNKWDLPKGKIEKGEKKKEAAIREVEEECGVSNLKIENKLSTTYHVFQRNEKKILKVTYWYKMSTSFRGKLTPQIEEDITEVEFKNAKEIVEAMKNTYKNIQMLFTH